MSSYIQQKKEDFGFDSLCLVDEDAMYYDRERSVSLLSSKEVTTKLLTDRQPIILDNMLSEEDSEVLAVFPVIFFIFILLKIGCVYVCCSHTFL